MEEYKEVYDFCHFVWHEYLEKRNYALLVSFMDERTTIIGTGVDEVSYNEKEFLAKFNNEEKQWDGNFTISNEEFHVLPLAKDLFQVVGEADAKQNVQQKDCIVYDFHFRFTAILEHKNQKWCLIHVHQSVADRYQGVDEYFPKAIIEESDRILKQKIKEKSEELEARTKEAMHYSHHDMLTQLYNRSSTVEKIKQQLKQATTGTLLMIDIDNFKTYNDTYGHPFGDQVLQEFAKCLKNCFKEGVVGRVGGDEFMIYLDSLSNVEEISNKMNAFFQKWIMDQNVLAISSSITTSIGVSFYPRDGENYDLLWGNADKALYQVKRSGKNNFSFYCQ